MLLHACNVDCVSGFFPLSWPRLTAGDGCIHLEMPDISTEMYHSFDVFVKGIEGFKGKNPNKRTVLLKVLWWVLNYVTRLGLANRHFHTISKFGRTLALHASIAGSSPALLKILFWQSERFSNFSNGHGFFSNFSKSRSLHCIQT